MGWQEVGVYDHYHSLGRISTQHDIFLFSFFSQKIGFDISCKLPPLETICIKCQSLLSEKNKKKYLKTSAEILHSILNINIHMHE